LGTREKSVTVGKLIKKEKIINAIESEKLYAGLRKKELSFRKQKIHVSESSEFLPGEYIFHPIDFFIFLFY